MIVLCIPYRDSDSIVKGPVGSLHYEYRLDFSTNWQETDFKTFPENSILTYRGSDFTQTMLQDMLSSKALIDLDVMQLGEFPDMVKPERLILSTHLDEYDEEKIKAFLEHPQEAKVYKLILNAKSFAEILATSALVSKVQEREVTFNAMGKWALFQRGFYALFNSDGVYAATGEPTSAGQPDLERLMPIWMSALKEDHKCIAIIGGEQVNESGSICLANEYFINQKLKYVYLPVPAGDLPEAVDLIKFLHGKVNLAGIAVTSPHKKAMAEYLRSNQPIINTAQLLDHKHLHNTYHPELDRYVFSQNTDLIALKKHMLKLEIKKDAKILIHGSGDCAEAFIQHLARQAFTDVSLLSRNKEKARLLIDKYQLKAAKDQVYDLLINATPLGKNDEDEISHLPKFKQLIDLVLRLDKPALLVQKAEAESLPHARGDEFWAQQFYAQFQCIIYEDEEII